MVCYLKVAEESQRIKFYKGTLKSDFVISFLVLFPVNYYNSMEANK